MATDKPTPPFTDAELKAFLAARRVVIASSQAASGKSIRKLAMQFGAKVDQAILCVSFEETLKEISTTPCHLLIADLFFEKNTGIELIEAQESKFVNRLDVATIMMCGDPSSNATGMMAEANVDAALIKPFTGENFKAALYQSLANKVKPSPYWKLIESGKELFGKRELEQAAQIFEKSKALDPRPTLAFYYLGQISRKKEDYTQAVQLFNEGLAFNPKDYRCLSALFETKMHTGEFATAYDIAARIHKDYPVSTSRILDLVKLSVYTKKYADIVDYYQIFKQLEKREPTLSRVVVAGMLICAKYFALNAKKSEALDVLQNAAKIATESGVLRVEVLRFFTETGNFREGETYYNEFPPELKTQRESLIHYLDLLHASEQTGVVISLGNQMLKDGVRTSRVYQILIENSKKLGRSEATLQGLIDEAKSYFPKEFT